MSLAEPYDDRDHADVHDFENIDGKFVAVPSRMKALQRDGKNCPVPHCAELTDGKPRLDAGSVVDCLLTKRCWVCYTKLGAHKAFVSEPVNAITRLNVLPPAHLECALFLVNVRHPETVTMVYICKKFDVTDRSLFHMGEMEDLLFRFQSREATADEIASSIENVFPELLAGAGQNEKTRAALCELHDGLMEMIPGMQRVKPRKVKIAEGA